MGTLEIGPHNVLTYLRGRGWNVGAGARVTALGGGVSNTVLLVESGGNPERNAPVESIVIKQALDKLRVEDDWRAQRDRAHRECRAIGMLRGALPPQCLPEIVFEDEPNFLFAMTAAPEGARPWKADLLEGRIEPDIAARTGELLARKHAFSCRNEAARAEFGDQTCFDQLRVDPYYRTCAHRHTDLAPRISKLIEEMTARRLCLVHGDYSPKNMLVWGRGHRAHSEVFLIDFEVIHYGDPAFDTGFCLNHLLLKSFHRPQYRECYLDTARVFWRAYLAAAPAAIGSVIEQATCHHLGALMLARVDGKSPAEYLTPEQRAQVRASAVRVLQAWPSELEEVFELCAPSVE